MPDGYDVVIVNYNGERIISKCLKSVYLSSLKPKKVIVYDNASSDQSIAMIEKNFPGVILIKGKSNIGFGGGNNKAMKHVGSELTLFLNNDVLLDKYCASILTDAFEKKALAVVNPLIIRGWGANSRKIYSFGAQLDRGGFGYSLIDRGKDQFDLSCFSGACFMARSSVIKNLKFEKKFFLYYEEPELSVRILKEKLRIGRVGRAKCFHLESYSSPRVKNKGIIFRQYYGIQNRWYMLGKHWPVTYLLRALPINIMHLLYNQIFFLRYGGWKSLGIGFLATKAILAGRRHYRGSNDLSWIKKLPHQGISELLSQKNSVYQ